MKQYLNIQRFVSILEQLKQTGKRVVTTNGCFDLFHYGHLRVLQEAKRKGDVLVVLVNTDESIRRIKGGDKPYNPLSTRMAILAALECVDYVVAFDEETPVQALEIIKPTCNVKGREKKEITKKDYPELNVVEIEWVDVVKCRQIKLPTKVYTLVGG